MRLLSVLFTAAIVTLGFAGVAAAQEESTRQTFETREITSRENTTPPSGQSARDVQTNAACPGTTLIGSVVPTEDDLATRRPFPVTGDSFRLTYETTDADESGFPFFDVTVLDEAGNEVGGRVIFEEGIQREIVRASPGSFDIETRAEDMKYKLTVEDCTGRNPGSPNPPTGRSGGGNGQTVPTDPIPEDQYRSDVDPPNEDVIDNTISDNPLPNTGGVPLLGLAAFGFIFTFAAFALLRPVMRRDS